MIGLHLPDPTPHQVKQDLSRFAKLVLSDQIMSYVADAERNPPYLRPLTTFGKENTRDPLATSEGWRILQDIGIKEGIVGIGYQQVPKGAPSYNIRVYQYLKYHLWSASSALVTCPSAMTDGAARLLGRHLDGKHGHIFREARERLISRQPGHAWTSGQWMTERKGGSDVRGTETAARKLDGREKEESDGLDALGFPLGAWRLDGFKWFSSATDANMTVLLAVTGKDGAVSAFYAPLRKRITGVDGETELNGIRIQRLKNKLGTKPVPTAELEIKGMRGYLLGKEGQGIKELSTILNITRIHNSISAVGHWGRGLAISRAYAKVRSVGGKLLADIPAHMRALAKDHVKYTANMHLTFFLTALLGISEGQNSSSTPAAQAQIIPKSKQQSEALLRVLTPIAKAQTALRSIKGLRACMENLGGVGYLENEDPLFNIARIFRDTCVLSIWEGTTDVMADDVARVVKGKAGLESLAALDQWISSALTIADSNRFKLEAGKLRDAWIQWLARIKPLTVDQMRWEGRSHLKTLEWVVCGCLLLLDASRDHNDVAQEITRRWIFGSAARSESWQEDSSWEKRIVFGTSTLNTTLKSAL
jgi:alkylation response protein AidB-like acyl-CoA dehydrogenase